MTDPDETTRRLLRGVSSATATLVLLKKGVRTTFIAGARPLNPVGCRFVAEAYTLRFIPMREDLSAPEVLADPDYPPRKIVEEVPTGAALVIDARGVVSAGVIGGILAARLRLRGVAAIVTDGAVRDSVELAGCGMPVFCAGAASPASLTSHFGSDYQNPIGCGGVAVIPGDILIGDEDGVVVIPRGLAAEVAELASEQERLEGFLTGLVDQGRSTIGTYPPNEATRREYQDWLAAGGGAQTPGRKS